MTTFRPRYITFDCYGTLTNFQMAEAARDLYSEQLDESRMAEFIKNFAAYRLDEILGHWKPYAEVVHNSLERTCKRNGMKFREEAARLVYERVRPGVRIPTCLPVLPGSPRRSRLSSCPTR